MSTAFPTNQSVIAAGYLFPGPVSPITWTFTLNRTTQGPLYFDQNGLATAHFFASLATPAQVNGTHAVAPVTVTIIAQLRAGSTLIGIQPQTRNLSLGGNVTEYNISFSPEVAAVGSPSSLTLSFTWYQASSNGQDLSSQIVFHSGAKYPVGIDLPLRAPVLVSAPTLATMTGAATVRAVVMSPFGSYDLSAVGATLNGQPHSGYSVVNGADSWKFTGLIAGTTYTVALTARDLQGQAVQVSVTWTQ
jgi:hypothetical protein